MQFRTQPWPDDAELRRDLSADDQDEGTENEELDDEFEDDDDLDDDDDDVKAEDERDDLDETG